MRHALAKSFAVRLASGSLGLLLWVTPAMQAPLHAAPAAAAPAAAAPAAAAPAAAAPAAAAPATVTPSDKCVPTNRRTGAELESKCYALGFGGLERTVRVYVPAARKDPMPLVVVMHGGGGSAGGMEWLTNEGFNRIADRDGALIVYPDGIGKGWNDGRTDMKSKSVAEHIDDLGFLRALPHELATLFPIDSQRVYATGISNGGLMSYRLACDAADVYAAVAPVAANMSVELAPKCRPARPISIAIIDGTDDPIMPWAGGPIKVLLSARGTVLSTRATADQWVSLDRCGALRNDGKPVDADPDDGTSLLISSADCAAHTQVRLYEVRGGGHTWPRGKPYLGKWIVGRVSQELDANEVIWQFFRQHALH